MDINFRPILFFTFLIFFSWEGYGQSRTITITALGTGTFPKPYQTTLQVSIWGAGGGGGFTGDNKGAGGGGGGAFTRVNSYTFGVGFTSAPFEVGSGGSGQSNSSSAIDGGTSSFGHTGNLFIANGGSKGSGLTGGAGGVASIFGDIRSSGGSSPNGTGSNNSGGSGGGGAGGISGNGQNGNNDSGATPRAGGAGNGVNSGGGGSGGIGSNPGANGSPGGNFGGGGGGEGRSNASGGNGGNGQIIISWACSNVLVFGNPNPTPVCLGTGFGPVVYDLIGATGYTLDWVLNGSPSAAPPSGVSVSNVDGRIIISGASTIAGTFSYTLAPIYPTVGTTSGSCSGPGSFNGSFSVTPNKTVGTISSSTFCQDSALPAGITQATTGATGIGTPTGLPTGVTAAWAGNQITFSGTPTVSGSFPYSIPLTGGCGTINATGTLTINETPSIKSQNTPGGTTCINGLAFSQMSVGTGFGYTYQWFSNDTPDYTTPNSISGATSNTYTPPNSTSETTYYYVVVSSPTCSAVTSSVSGAYIVTPTNTVTAASSSPTVCISTALPSAITHTTTGATAIGAIAWSPSNPGGMSTSFISNTISISGTPANSGVFTYSIPLIGGCGTVNATGTITVNATAAIISPNLRPAGQSRCINTTAFGAISVANRTGFTYQWYSNTTNVNSGGSPITGANSSSYLPLNTVVGTKYYYVEVSSSGSCGTIVTSGISGAFVVNALPIVSFIAQPSSPTCVDSDVTYSTQAGETNYVWTIPGILGTDYSITSGGNGSSSLVLKWLTPGSKSVTVNYQDAQGCGATSPATSNTTTVNKNTVSAASAYASVCLNGTIIPFTHTTTGATGIGAASGLPAGLNAGFSGNTITISGTIAATVTPGFYNYTIPLTGGCGTVTATGTIEVTPVYTLTSISSVSPSNVGGKATITINGDPTILVDGTYEVSYTLGLANSGSGTTTLIVTNGKGTFTTPIITSEDLTSLTITAIKKATDACTIPLSINNTTFFGIKAVVFDQSGTFYVPAGIFEITIKVWGGGGGGGNGSAAGGGGGGGYSTITIPVIPGEPIGIYVGIGGTSQTNGQQSYATRDPNFPNSLVYANGGNAGSSSAAGSGGSLVSGTLNSAGSPGGKRAGYGGKGGNGGGTNGGTGAIEHNDGKSGTTGNAPGGGGSGGNGNGTNQYGGKGGQGLILISYPLPPVNPCFKVIDDGAISGTTIIEFTCDYTWTAPEGLADFTVYVGSGGGGGGSGFGSGGGGSGALIKQLFSTSNPYGLPAGSTFPITVGTGGLGASTQNTSGGNGNPSSFSGHIDGSSINILVQGGGGGGSQSSISGANGSSGGGGGARPNPSGQGGKGGNSIPISYSGPNVTLYHGNPGGNGDYNTNQNAIAGGGGGGLIPWVASDRPDGKAAGNGQGEGGDGGKGVSLIMGDSIKYFGAGGGGIGEYFNGTEKVGIGGSVNGVILGGDGNLSSPSATGGTGRNKTGSGGGAGYGKGGKGGDGVVYIVYENFRILEVEYLYFDVKYNSENRSDVISWATAKEWENSHFEIERSVNGVSAWTKIGQEVGQGYSESPKDYSYTDTNLPASGGVVYYRLKQVDFDGSFSYSVTKSIKVEGIKGQGSWVAYPNPSSKKNAIKVNLLNHAVYNDEPILIQISDIRGVSETFTVNQVESVSEVVNRYMEQSKPGVYILQLIWGNNSQQLKLLRE